MYVSWRPIQGDDKMNVERWHMYKMSKMGFVSADTYVVRAGQHFNASLMDAERQASPEAQAPVPQCTVELGLAIALEDNRCWNRG